LLLVAKLTVCSEVNVQNFVVQDPLAEAHDQLIELNEQKQEDERVSTELADKLMGDLDINADEVVVKSTSDSEEQFAEIKSDSGYEDQESLWQMEELTLSDKLDNLDTSLDYDTEVENEIESVADLTEVESIYDDDIQLDQVNKTQLIIYS